MAITWTHPSVVCALEYEGTDDPIGWVENASRELSLDAMEKGWEGPTVRCFQVGCSDRA